MTHTRTRRDLPIRPTAQPVRYYRRGQNYLLVGRLALAGAVLEILACAAAVREGALTFQSRAFPLLTALFLLLAILAFVFPLRAERIDRDYSVAEDLGPVDHPGEGSGQPLAIEAAAR